MQEGYGAEVQKRGLKALPEPAIVSCASETGSSHEEHSFQQGLAQPAELESERGDGTTAGKGDVARGTIGGFKAVSDRVEPGFGGV